MLIFAELVIGALCFAGGAALWIYGLYTLGRGRMHRRR